MVAAAREITFLTIYDVLNNMLFLRPHILAPFTFEQSCNFITNKSNMIITAFGSSFTPSICA